MRNFGAVFWLDSKRFFKLGKLVMVFIVFAIGIIIAISGIYESKKIHSKSQNFQEIDSLRVKKITNYDYYNAYGVRYFLVPSPLGKIIKSTGVNAELLGRLDAIATLDIHINGKSGAIFDVESPSTLCLSILLLLLGSLLVMFFGRNLMRDREFLKTIASCCGHFRSFVYIILSRIIQITFVLLVFFSSLVLITKILGIDFSNSDLTCLSGYFAGSLIMLISFFLLGVLIGSYRQKDYAIYTLLALWFLFVYIIPNVLNAYIARRADSITSSHKIEVLQMTLVNRFEKEAEEKHGKPDKSKIEVGRQVGEDYFSNVYPKIEFLENRLKSEIAENIELKRDISIWLPTTFFQLNSKYVSGYGLDNFLRFYTFLQKEKKGFARFWIDRVFYNDPKVIVSYIDENHTNLFYASATLPENFLKGVIINLAYCFILFFVAFFRFKRCLFPISKIPGAYKDMKFSFIRELNKTVYFFEPGGIHHPFINAFFGQFKSFEGQIELDDETIDKTHKKNILYLPQPDDIPGDIKPIELLTFFKRSYNLTNDQFSGLIEKFDAETLHKPFEKLKRMLKIEILLAVAGLGKFDICIFKDFSDRLSDKEQVELAERFYTIDREDKLFLSIITCGSVWRINKDNILTFQIGIKNNKIVFV